MRQKLSSSLSLFSSDLYRAKKIKLNTKKNVFIGVGGNIAPIKRRFDIFMRHLISNNRLKILAISPLLKNPPFGFVDQEDFLNFVLAIKTDMSSKELFYFLRQRENRFYRQREFKNAPRTLDLDIIFYKNQNIKNSLLSIPHPFYRLRSSVMIPLDTIANIPHKSIATKAPKIKKQKVIIGLSGGVDSSVSALLLLQEGYDVEGVYMKLHNASEAYHSANLEAIAKVANFLGIKYHILDIQEEFRQEVYDYFVESYRQAITPNPCVKCNQKIKFGALFDFAKGLGADFVATGHYAKTDGQYIYEAEDKSKDQSYFLAQVKQEVLSSILFPMDKYHKTQIKEYAAKIPVYKELATKKESQEICFVPTVYTDILKNYYPIDREGAVLNTDGKVVGTHKGYMHYTIGKRRGFSVKGALEPHFVTQIDPTHNTLVVGKKEDLAIYRVVVNNLNLFVCKDEFKCLVKLRYRSSPSECVVKVINDEAMIQLIEPAYGVAIGQVAVFYDGDKVLGSGWIIKASK